MIFLRRNSNTLPHGFPSLSETFQLVRTLRQVSPDGDSFTPSGWPVTGTLAGPLRSVEGLHPPGIFNSNEKRILPSAAIRKRIHFGDWPVYCRIPSQLRDRRAPESRRFPDQSLCDFPGTGAGPKTHRPKAATFDGLGIGDLRRQ